MANDSDSYNEDVSLQHKLIEESKNMLHNNKTKMKNNKSNPKFTKLLKKNSADPSPDNTSDEENPKKKHKKNKNLQEEIRKTNEHLQKLTALLNRKKCSSDDESKTPILSRNLQQPQKSKIEGDVSSDEDEFLNKKQMESPVITSNSTVPKLNSKLLQAANLSMRKDFLRKIITNSNDVVANCKKQNEISTDKIILKRDKPKSPNEDSFETVIDRKILLLSQGNILKIRQSDISFMDTSFANVMSSTQIPSQDSSSSNDDDDSPERKQIEIKTNTESPKSINLSKFKKNETKQEALNKLTKNLLKPADSFDSNSKTKVTNKGIKDSNDLAANTKRNDDYKKTLSVEVLKSIIKLKNIPAAFSSDSDSDSDDSYAQISTAKLPQKIVYYSKQSEIVNTSKFSQKTATTKSLKRKKREDNISPSMSDRMHKLSNLKVIVPKNINSSMYDSVKEFLISNPNLEQIDVGTNFVFNDLKNDDEKEIWLMQLPKNFDPNSMKGQKIIFENSRSKLNNGTKYEYETQKNDLNICLIASNSANNKQLNLKSIKTKGTVIVHEVLNLSEVKERKETKVQPPENLKERYPIFGPNFQEKIYSNGSIESIRNRLLEAEIIKREADKKIENKKKRKSMKNRNEFNKDEMIYKFNKDEMIYKLLEEKKDELETSGKKNKKLKTDAPKKFPNITDSFASSTKERNYKQETKCRNTNETSIIYNMPLNLNAKNQTKHKTQ